MVCTGCCATLDHIVTYLFKLLTQKGIHAYELFVILPIDTIAVYPGKKSRVGIATSSDMFLKVLEIHPEILQQILSTVLNVIMFEDCRNQWSMSRPLLGLILLNEEYFNQLRENIIRSQPPDKQAAMAQWFENLMDGIERNLLTKNRDRYVNYLIFCFLIIFIIKKDSETNICCAVKKISFLFVCNKKINNKI